MSSPQWMRKRQVRLRLTDAAIDRLDMISAICHCSRSVAADALIRASSEREAAQNLIGVINGDASALMAWKRGGNESE